MQKVIFNPLINDIIDEVRIYKRALSILEVLTEYLKDKLELSYHQTAVMLNRDDRTIWTIYFRAKKRRNKK